VVFGTHALGGGLATVFAVQAQAGGAQRRLQTAHSGLGCTCTSKGPVMLTTKIFKNGNSQAIRIPAELAYGSWDMEFAIERNGDELRIRPVARRMGDVLGKLAKFSPDFMASGRGMNVEKKRRAL
jgi:antitoxin VapB